MSRRTLLPIVALFALAFVLPRFQTSDLELGRRIVTVSATAQALQTQALPAPAGEMQPAEPPPVQAWQPQTVTPEPPKPEAAQSAPPAQPLVECSMDGGSVNIAFAWQPLYGGQEQWLDVSNVDNGFRLDTRWTTGPLRPDVASHTWEGLPDSPTPLYWRINTRSDDGWMPSPTRTVSPCAATGLTANAQCGPGPHSVEFGWTPSTLPVNLQYLEVSSFDNGFAANTFRSADIPPGETQISWQDLPGAAVLWRVHTLTPRGWRSSEVHTVPSCDTPLLLAPRYTCAGNKALVEFRWAPAGQAMKQFLDLSMVLNGFAPGTFVNSGDLPPDAERHLWPGVEPNVAHYYRIHTLSDSGWKTSVTRSFTAACPSS
jgi:hypothetical protein